LDITQPILNITACHQNILVLYVRKVYERTVKPLNVTCTKWCHIRCGVISEARYEDLKRCETDFEWICDPCTLLADNTTRVESTRLSSDFLFDFHTDVCHPRKRRRTASPTITPLSPLSSTIIPMSPLLPTITSLMNETYIIEKTRHISSRHHPNTRDQSV